MRYRFEVVSDYAAFRDLQRHRMLTIEWQQKELTDTGRADGPWLLISTSDAADLLANKLTDALKVSR